MSQKILFATGNKGKARELKEAFKTAGVDVELKLMNWQIIVNSLQLLMILD